MNYWGWKVWGVEATGHKIHKVENNLTRLTFSMDLWWAPYIIVCIFALKRIDKLVNQRYESKMHGPSPRV